MWKYLILGVLIGWLLHWLLDWCVWRRRRAAGDAAIGRQPTDVEPRDRPEVIEPNTGATTTAHTSAGRIAGEVAIGAAGAVSTSSATLTTGAPVYRQEDLEAISGIGPKIGAMLRNNGITTFSLLAATPVAELARIVQSTGEAADEAGVETWPRQARLAASQDWAGLAAFNSDRPVPLQDRR